MSARILLIEDDPDLGAQMERGLREAGYSTLWLRDGTSGPGFEERFDLVILDLTLPTSYGLDIVKDLRSRSEVPVIVVAARADRAVKRRRRVSGAE